MNDIELIDEIVRRADEHQKQKEKEFAIAELEKIKAEIKEYCEFCDDALYQSTKGVMLIFNKHIKELKGETNEIL